MEVVTPPVATSQPVEGIALGLETVDCPLCGGKQFETVIEGSDTLGEAGSALRFKVVRCFDCSLSFTNPRPTLESIGQFYPEEYSCHQFASRPERRTWNRQYPMDKLLPPDLGGRLLDFGCGMGNFLRYVRGRGWWPTGLDLSPRVVDSLRKELHLPILLGTLPHPELAPASFEAVTMWQALEHVHDPLAVVREAHKLLIPGGRLVLAVPNIDSLPFEWFGADWHGLELPRHLTHFSPTTLSCLLERAGFESIGLHMVRHNGWLRHSARLARRDPAHSAPLCRLMKRRWWSSWAGSYSELKGRANCLVASAVKA